MPFNSFEYLVFFLSVLAVSWLLAGRPQIRIVFLLAASYYFYASNNGWLLALIGTSTLIDYIAGLRIQDTDDQKKRKAWLIGSLAVNLGILGFFKYFNFAAQSVAGAAHGMGIDASIPVYDIALPVGISFYTFQSMSYTIDVYMKRLEAERSFIRFAFFVSFFPQLVAGPIVRARYFLHQVGDAPKLGVQALEASLYLIFWGLFKKIVLADTLGVYADAAFAAPENASAAVAWLGLYAFTFQIYFDFSGYTDIAIGCARLLGYRLPPNFKRPYTAASLTEFWRKWHISLSFWLRDYLYKPLGGNRKGPGMTYFNLMVTMLLGGLWHGAAWTFVLWGGIHGAILALEKLTGQVRRGADYKGRAWKRILRSIVIFHVVVLTWLPFRATSWDNMTAYAQSLVNVDAGWTLTLGMVVAALIILGGLGAQWLGELTVVKRRFLALPLVVKAFMYAGLACAIVIFSARGVQPFVYFQF